MITLYDYLPSQNAYKIRLLLKHLDCSYRTEEISIFEGEGQTEEYLTINPTGAVPALQLEDGRTIAESNAILLYLAEGTPFLPDDTYHRAKVLQWLFFEGETVQSTVATLRHWVLTGKDKNRTAEIIEARRSGSMQALRILDSELAVNSYLGGGSYTIADISVFAYVHLAEEAGLPLAEFGNIVRWIGSIQAQPRFLDKTYPYSIDPHSALELP
ncbi:glutathione S-transferase [Chromatiales bacterium (ex Bugula neritina AB1)]|nr:glutathione S-transferase [Chromatiales bacterium (ex Bugula neritina AB1)]